MFPLQIDMRNPIVHMTLWQLIATGGLLLFLLIFTSIIPSGRDFLFQSGNLFFLGLVFWMFIALVVAAIGGLITGSLIWALTFSALVSDRTITRYYLSVWVWIGFLLLLVYGLVGWWYASSDQWALLPLTADPRTRDVMLGVVWMVVIPLIGATRFVDDLKADARYLRKRE